MSSSIYFKFKPFNGPKRFVFVDPDTDYQFEGRNKQELMAHIINYRAQNGLEPIEYLSLVLENYWCGLKENAGMCSLCDKMQRGIFKYLKGGIALFKQVAFKQTCSLEQAEARAAICETCPMNILPTQKGFEGWANTLAETMTSGQKTSKHDTLGECKVCSCLMRAKVFQGGVVTINKMEAKAFPEYCWQLKEGVVK